MEWTFVPLDTYEEPKEKISTLQEGESIYSVFTKGQKKFLIYVANITNEDTETLEDIRELVKENVLTR